MYVLLEKKWGIIKVAGVTGMAVPLPPLSLVFYLVMGMCPAVSPKGVFLCTAQGHEKVTHTAVPAKGLIPQGCHCLYLKGSKHFVIRHKLYQMKQH